MRLACGHGRFDAGVDHVVVAVVTGAAVGGPVTVSVPAVRCRCRPRRLQWRRRRRWGRRGLGVNRRRASARPGQRQRYRRLIDGERTETGGAREAQRRALLLKLPRCLLKHTSRSGLLRARVCRLRPALVRLLLFTRLLRGARHLTGRVGEVTGRHSPAYLTAILADDGALLAGGVGALEAAQGAH